MRIGIDIRSLIHRPYSGIGEYTIELLNHLFLIDRDNQYFLFINNWQPLTNFPRFEYPNVKLIKFNYPNKLLNLSFRLFNYPKVDSLINKLIGCSIDLFFMPNLNYVAFSQQIKKVITCHDLSFKIFPQFLNWRQKFWHKAIKPSKLFSKMDKIIAVSQNTKTDLINLYHLPADKINVIYSGISNRCQIINDQKKLQTVAKKYTLPKRFILCLGSLEPRKNILSLISAFSQIDKINDYHLVIAGTNKWRSSSIYRATQKSKYAQRIIFPGYLDEADKPAVYNLADLFIYSSWYEGFGFPPLEAMACGTPTIVSAVSSLPEITQGVAILINPLNINEMKQAIEQIILNKVWQQQLIIKGLAQAKKFSWEKTALQTLTIFQSLK